MKTAGKLIGIACLFVVAYFADALFGLKLYIVALGMSLLISFA